MNTNSPGSPTRAGEASWRQAGCRQRHGKPPGPSGTVRHPAGGSGQSDTEADTPGTRSRPAPRRARRGTTSRARCGRPATSLSGSNCPPGRTGSAALCQAATTSPNTPTCFPPRTRRRHAVLQPWLRLGRPPLPGVARTMRARTPKAKSSCSPWIKLPAARSSTRYSSTRSPGARQPATGRDEIRVQRGSHGQRAGPGDVGSADGTRDPRDLPSSWLCGDDNPQILMCAAGPGADHDNLLPAHHPGLVDPQAGPLRWRRLATCGPD